MSAAQDILGDYQHVIDSLTFTTGSKGIFEVTVDGDTLYSKQQMDRHAEPGEVGRLFEEKYGQGVTKYAKT